MARVYMDIHNISRAYDAFKCRSKRGVLLIAKYAATLGLGRLSIP